MNTVAQFEGVWVKIEGVMENPKNRQMWDFGSWEVEFGIGSLGMKYEEWNCRGVSEVSGKTELKPRRYGQKTEWILFFFIFIFRNWSATVRKWLKTVESATTRKWAGTKWICNGMELTNNSSGERKSVIVELKIDMDPRYVWLPIGSRESLGHQCCLTACVLG